MQLAVLAQALQLNQPHRLDVHDFIGGFIVNRTTIDGFGGFVHQLDIQHLRVNLLNTVTLAVAGQTVEEYGNVCFHISANQRQLVMLLHAELALIFHFLILCQQLRQEAVKYIVFRSAVIQPCKQSHAADQNAPLLVHQPAHGTHFQKYILTLGNNGAVGHTHIAADAVLVIAHADNFLCTQSAHRHFHAADGDAAACFHRSAAAVFPFRQCAETLVQNHIGIAAEFHSHQTAVLLSAAEELFVTLFQLHCGTYCAGIAVLVAAEAVYTAAIRQKIVDGGAVYQKAVVRTGQQCQVGGRGSGANGVQQGQAAAEYLFM